MEDFFNRLLDENGRVFSELERVAVLMGSRKFEVRKFEGRDEVYCYMSDLHGFIWNLGDKNIYLFESCRFSGLENFNQVFSKKESFKIGRNILEKIRDINFTRDTF